MCEPKDLDTLLAIRCQLGDQDAWRELVERWHPRLWHFVLRLVSNPAVAEDILQNVWLKVVRSLGALRQPERLDSWLYRIARVTVADQLRDQYRRPISAELGEIEDEQPGHDLIETVDAVESGLERLHVIEREVVILHYLAGCSVGQTAEICGVPEGTVKSRLSRARRLLRDILANDGKGT